ncbi:uncharacterized protein N7483_012405 [Penicillium malachiteum]|uniref:uncharacterized protein n=1 Tax=Penicillium malachiteum TaxID=1324776 RepID=UPI0025479E82|nr:uncharacterized protein N7483_012405 [Penicillium malachiteum]KAJ5715224.1 hypothetical protein N7483_012405 [Penicillium malachiteum]
MTTPFLDSQGNCIPQEHVLGSGSSALVLLQGDIAVKVPLKCLWSDPYEVQTNTEKLKHEQEAYRRLQDLPYDDRSIGVVQCIDMLSESTQLAYMSNGDLKSYLTRSRPSPQLQLSWCYEITRTLTFIHDRCILVTDIASRNFLLDSDLSIKFCDFSEASILPLDSDMKTVDDCGFNTQIDIGLLGTVMYEIVTGETIQVELFAEQSLADGRPCWPKREFLPGTNGVWLGGIIDGCWNGKFQTAQSVLQALHNIRAPLSIQSNVYRLGQAIRNSNNNPIKNYPFMTVIGVVGLLLIIGRKAASQFKNLQF